MDIVLTKTYCFTSEGLY